MARRTLTWAWDEYRSEADAARSTATPARSTASGRARACCTCCASGSALPGSKNACEQGECGSCSVYLDGDAGVRVPGRGRARPRAARSSPSRGWRRRRTSCTRSSEAFVEAGAVQCGFCTPGLIVATHDLLARNPSPSDAEIREALAGNLCRCTGYEKILDAVRLAAVGAMTTVIDDCAIATVDADGHRVHRRARRDRRRPDHRARRGPPRARGRGPSADRRQRLPRHAGPGQLPPPPLPVGHARPVPAGDAVRVADRLVPDLGRASTPRSSAPRRAPGSPRSR